MSSSSPPEVPVETGSHSDFKIWDVNSMAEPIMRVWQLSEALSRMAKRIQKRYPDEAKILKTSSEEIIHRFFLDMQERQKEFVENSKANEATSTKEQDERQRKARSEKFSPIKEGDSGSTPTIAPLVEDSSTKQVEPNLPVSMDPRQEHVNDDLRAYSDSGSGTTS
jgi:alanyl-tRNA synthetase